MATPEPRSADFMAALAKKWCPDCGHHLPRAECVCQVIAAAIREGLVEAHTDKGAYMAQWARRFGTDDPETAFQGWITVCTEHNAHQQRVEGLEEAINEAWILLKEGWSSAKIQQVLEAALHGTCPSCGETMDGVGHGQSECNMRLHGGRTG